MEWTEEQPASVKLPWTLHKLTKRYLSGGSGQIPLPSVCREKLF